MNYQEVNSRTIDQWCREGWEWGQPISHEAYLRAVQGQWDVLLTPVRPVPHEWLGELRGRKILGLASGGGQQMPIFSALGASCTVLDYSGEQCRQERLVAEREGYSIEIVQADMTKPLPFADCAFDIIFHPVSNCYVEEVRPIFMECFRVLKRGGILLCGLDTGLNYAFGEGEDVIRYTLPFNPLKDKKIYEDSIENDWGLQFSHTLEEQLGGQLEAGFQLAALYDDTNGSGNLHAHNIPTYVATRAVKP